MPRPLFDPTIDYYRVLGVVSSANDQEIRAAYRRLAKSYHPDLHAGSPLAAARMARVNAAKEVLLHARVRTDYDASRRARYGPTTATHPPQVTWTWSAPASPRSQAPTRPRPGPASPVRPTIRPKQGNGWLDRWSVGLVLLVVPLVLALAFYVADAVRVSQTPTATAPTTLGLAPLNRPDPKVLACAAYRIAAVSGVPNRKTAQSVTAIVNRTTESSPDADELRSISARLNRAAADDDAHAWNSAVSDFGTLAGHC